MTTQLERIENELRLAGFRLEPVKEKFESDDDYSQSIGTSVWEVCKLFCSQGHSEFSAECAIEMIIKLLKGKALSPLTNDPSEWENLESFYGTEGKTQWQSKRDIHCFSDDNLKTYYDIDDEKNREWEVDEAGKRTGWSFVKPKEQLIRHELKSKDELFL